jgi:hypothetical protein
VSREEREMSSNDGGGFGCLGIIVGVIVIWALVFGVTVDGNHYGLSCSCNDGVTVEKEHSDVH